MLRRSPATGNETCVLGLCLATPASTTAPGHRTTRRFGHAPTTSLANRCCNTSTTATTTATAATTTCHKPTSATSPTTLGKPTSTTLVLRLNIVMPQKLAGSTKIAIEGARSTQTGATTHSSRTTATCPRPGSGRAMTMVTGVGRVVVIVAIGVFALQRCHCSNMRD